MLECSYSFTVVIAITDITAIVEFASALQFYCIVVTTGFTTATVGSHFVIESRLSSQSECFIEFSAAETSHE